MTVNRGLIIMTGLVLTTGHQFLVDTAAEYMDAIDGELDIIVFDRSFEPISGVRRQMALARHFAGKPWVNVFVGHDDNAPQNDDGTQEFWDYWVKIAFETTGATGYSHVFASEAYGNTYAKHLNAEFVPVDIERVVYPVKGTTVRRNLNTRFRDVMPTFKEVLARRIVFFGAESTGKTTMSRKMSTHPMLGGKYLPEWARPYLEQFGPEVTDDRMTNIMLSQFSIQRAVTSNLETPWIYQDTDLLSTIGYYRIYGGKQPAIINELFEETKGDLYVVMNSGIPFEMDPLRYGGSVRESSDQFWIDLLEEFGCNYYVVESTDQLEQEVEISNMLVKFQADTFRDLVEFERD